MVNDPGAKGKPRSARPGRRGRPASTVDADIPDHLEHILYLHEMLQRRFGRELGGLMDHESDPLLRPSHRRILQLIPRDGCRPTTLAQRAELTKQSVGELLAHLEAHGYIEQSPDEHDRRAIWVRRSAAGRAAAVRTSAGIEALEARWRREVGADRYDTFRAVFAELVEPVGLDDR